jgi:hypothetical protein
MSRKVLARSLILLVALAMGGWFAPSTPAFAATQKKLEVPGTNWFWQSQNRRTPSELGVKCPEGSPTCPDPSIGLPNPHEPGALPVMVLNGQIEKVSAVQFDTEFLPVQGADVESFVFTVVESPDARDRFQTFNAEDRKIMACLIEDIWPPSEDAADEMQYAPPWNCDVGVEGKRVVSEDPLVPTHWEFDATKIAEVWGEDPFASFGVMLVPVATNGGLTETWQLVLKGPRRDVSDTPIDEAEPNKNNIQAKLVYTPNPEEDDGLGGIDTGGDTGGFDFGGDTGTTVPDPVPPADTGSDTGTDTGTDSGPSAAPASNNQPDSAWYVWLLLPALIGGIGMARAAVLEPAGGRRPDGVVAMIRAQNAARRGGTILEDAPGPGLLAAPFVALFASIRQDLSNARSKIKRKGS